MIIKGSITHDSFGRKRHSVCRSQKGKSRTQDSKTFRGHFPQYKTDNHREQYPSMTMDSYTPASDTSYKQETSKNYTVSIAYNKGAYQVIPKSDIKFIGR